MNLKMKLWLSAFGAAVLGTLLHFTYQWSGYNPIVGLFSAVSESTWEHLKLLAIPMLLFLLPEYLLYGKEYPNFIPVRFLSILIGMAVIVTSFYTYTGIVGTNFLWADIGTFLLGIFSALLFTLKMLPTRHFSSQRARLLSYLGILLLVFCFFLFTFYPPKLALFQPPHIDG